MGLTKKIAFDENSMPPKDQIWYRGEGKFYEYKDGKWVLAYDLAGTPSQEELESVANIIEEKTGKTLENKSLPEILSAIVDSIPTETPRLIVLTGFPQEDSGQSDLDAIGLTIEEIQAAAAGKRTAVIYNGGYYVLTTARYFPNDGNYEIAFYKYDFNSEGGFATLTGCSVFKNSLGVINVTLTDI